MPQILEVPRTDAVLVQMLGKKAWTKSANTSWDMAVCAHFPRN